MKSIQKLRLTYNVVHFVLKQKERKVQELNFQLSI